MLDRNVSDRRMRLSGSFSGVSRRVAAKDARSIPQIQGSAVDLIQSEVKPMLTLLMVWFRG